MKINTFIITNKCFEDKLGTFLRLIDLKTVNLLILDYGTTILVHF